MSSQGSPEDVRVCGAVWNRCRQALLPKWSDRFEIEVVHNAEGGRCTGCACKTETVYIFKGWNSLEKVTKKCNCPLHKEVLDSKKLDTNKEVSTPEREVADEMTKEYAKEPSKEDSRESSTPVSPQTTVLTPPQPCTKELVRSPTSLPRSMHTLVFAGFDGTKFQFSGFPGDIYNLISSKKLQVNMQIAELNLPGSSFITSLGIKYSDTMELKLSTHMLNKTLASMKIQLNGKVVSKRVCMSTTFEEARFTYTGTPNGEFVTISTPFVSLVVSQQLTSNHLDVRFQLHNRCVDMHGIVGQTSSEDYIAAAREGSYEDEFRVSGLFEDDFEHTLFGVDVAPLESIWAPSTWAAEVPSKFFPRGYEWVMI